MKPIQSPKIHHLRSIYAHFAKRLLENNPTWYGKYEQKVKLSNCYIMATEKGKPVVKMSWYIWKETVERFYHKVKYAVIAGETFKIGSNLGKIRGARIQRDFSKPKVDIQTTYKLRLKNEDGSLKKIYFTAEEYCRIQWLKYQMIPNESCYNFSPAEKNTATKTGFKIEFSQALTKNPKLKYKYKYYPVILKQPECNTPTAPSEM